MRPRRIIPYRMILITGLSLVRNINILSRVCKTGKVYILHARHTLPFVVYIFFKCKIFTFFKFNWPRRSHPVVIIQWNCCVNVIVEFDTGMKMFV